MGRAAGETVIRRAQHICAQRDVHLSAAHQTILRLLLKAPQPLTAYGLRPLFEKAVGRSTQPLTVYRLLDFLIGHGLVARIESRRAYVVIAEPEMGRDVVFLLCEVCEGCEQLDPGEVAPVLAASARGLGFAPSRMVIELQGCCRRCVGRL
jgi:Fur family zinc uptake transcriptional regulator